MTRRHYRRDASGARVFCSCPIGLDHDNPPPKETRA